MCNKDETKTSSKLSIGEELEEGAVEAEDVNGLQEDGGMENEVVLIDILYYTPYLHCILS